MNLCKEWQVNLLRKINCASGAAKFAFGKRNSARSAELQEAPAAKKAGFQFLPLACPQDKFPSAAAAAEFTSRAARISLGVSRISLARSANFPRAERCRKRLRRMKPASNPSFSLSAGQISLGGRSRRIYLARSANFPRRQPNLPRAQREFPSSKTNISCAAKKPGRSRVSLRSKFTSRYRPR